MSTFLEAFLNFTFDSAEPCFGEGLALGRPAQPEQEALQGRAVPADGAGPAAAAAGERAAPGGGAPRQGRPPPVQRNGDGRLEGVPPALRLPSDRTWNLLLTPAGATAGRHRPVNEAARSVLGGQGAGGGERRSEAGAGGPAGTLRRKQSSNRGWMDLSCLLTGPPVLPEALRRTRPGAAGEPSAGERSSEDADVPHVLTAHRGGDISPPEGVDLSPVLRRRSTNAFFQTLQAQFGGLLPPPPHRVPRVQNRADDEENAQVRKRPAALVHAHLFSVLHLPSLPWWPPKPVSFGLNSLCPFDFRLCLVFIWAVCPRLVMVFCLHCQVGCLARGTSVLLNSFFFYLSSVAMWSCDLHDLMLQMHAVYLFIRY